MKRRFKNGTGEKFALAFFLIAGFAVYASGAQELLNKYEKEAGKKFNSAEGKEFFEKKNAKTEKSCIDCHNRDIKKAGSQKVFFSLFAIEVPALSVSANKEAFKSSKKAAKEFDNYCEEVWQRVCTAEEKGNMLLYFMEN